MILVVTCSTEENRHKTTPHNDISTYTVFALYVLICMTYIWSPFINTTAHELPSMEQHIFNVWQKGQAVKVTHNTCSLHLATHFQNQTSHMGMFYMVYRWQG